MSFFYKNLIKPIQKILIFSLLFFSSLSSNLAAQTQQSIPSALEAWDEMTYALLTGEGGALNAAGTNVPITWGAEKEGSSQLITRVMGPNEEAFSRFVKSMKAPNRKKFLNDFLKGWDNGTYRNKKPVNDLNGNVVAFDESGLRQQNWDSMSLDQLQEKFDLWMDRAGDKSFSFLNPSTRAKLYKSQLPGQSKTPHFRVFQEWEPLYGEPQRYIPETGGIHATSLGWEINFKPQNTYGDFQKMIHWFKNSLKNNGVLFDAPGHQRLVFSKPSKIQKPAFKKAMSNLYQGLQAYIVLRGQEGRSGMEYAGFKDVLEPGQLDPYSDKAARGMLRADEPGRFKRNTFSLEFRGGTKGELTRSLAQRALVSRIASGDFSGLEHTIWNPISGQDSDTLAKLNNIDPKDFETAVKRLKNAKTKIRNADRYLNNTFLTPLWDWQNAPFLSETKKSEIKKLTQAFVNSVNKLPVKPTSTEILELLHQWAKASNLSQDLATYISPKGVNSTVDDLAHFKPTQSVPRRKIDVNKIDVGIEHTARFPLRLEAAYSQENLSNGRRAWLGTHYDLGLEEREKTIEKVAKDLQASLGGKGVVEKVNSDHGHGLDMAYEFSDSQNRKWRVEWDGIGRDYLPDGQIIPE